jgi:hypothetical protein
LQQAFLGEAGVVAGLQGVGRLVVLHHGGDLLIDVVPVDHLDIDLDVRLGPISWLYSM